MKDNRRTQADRSAATQAALVAAGRTLFAERGYAHVGTEEIVRAAGTSRGALYHHFADKSELFAAVFEAVEADITARIAAAVAAAAGGPDGADLDPITAMRVGASTWLDACTEPEVQRIALLDAPAVLGWERWTEISNRYNIGLVQELLSHAIAVGRIPQQPVPPLAHALLGTVREAALYLVRAYDRATDQAQARTDMGAVIDRMIEALAVP
jgi:AcrR family transcriptional regulator